MRFGDIKMGKDKKKSCEGCHSNVNEEYNKQVKEYAKYYNDYVKQYGCPPAQAYTHANLPFGYQR